MEITTLLDIHTREELYRWYQENHDKATDFWLRINRAEADCPGVVRYVDAVEVALCFGWIDSTMKRWGCQWQHHGGQQSECERCAYNQKPIQHFTPRRKGSNWCEQNLVRCRRLVETGEMTPAGLAVIPDIDPSHFVYEDWVIDAIKADKQAWKHYRSFPENYRRIKVDRIQHYYQTRREDYAFKTLRKFIDDCHNGKMQSGWSDFGRLGA